MKPFYLTPFEEYFLVDDRPSYPAVFYLRLELAGPFNLDHAQNALNLVGSQHPFMHARIERDRRGRSRWVDNASNQKIQWILHRSGDAKAGNFPPMPPLDVVHDSTLRIYCVENTDGHAVIFQAHHAAFDGLGFFQIVKDWLSIYRQLANRDGSAPKLREYDAGLLAGRCQPALSFTQWRKLLPGQWKSILAAFQFISRNAIPLVPMAFEKRQELAYQDRPDVITRQLDVAETNNLRLAAQAMDSSVNNILARDLFIAIDRWQIQQQFERDGSHLRIMIPVNERTSLQRNMPACNHCTMINLDRLPIEIQDPEKLHEGIRQEMTVIKKWRLSLNFWRALSVFRRLPGGLRRQTHSGQCGATCLLTNLGNADYWIRPRPSKIKTTTDILVINDIEMVAPLRTGMYAAFVVYYFRNQLYVTLHYDSRVIPPNQGTSLIEHFLNQIRQSCCPTPFAGNTERKGATSRVNPP